MTEETGYRPLAGVKVVELSTMVAASSLGRILCDWGAESIKVEGTKGDPFRNFPKNYRVPCTPDENPLFDSLNGGKQGLVLDLKTPEGMEILHRLLAEADVFITNNRQKSLDKMGLDYGTLKARYPRLVYAQITGYGDAGPKAASPGYDTVAFWANTGFNADMSVDSPGSYPVYGGVGPGDLITALSLFGAIASALYKRTVTGEGDRVSISLYGTGLWCFHLMAVPCEKQYGYTYPRTRYTGTPLGSPYRTRDNEWIMTTIPNVETQWEDFCAAMDMPELKEDPRFTTTENLRSPENSSFLIHHLEEKFLTRTAAQWDKALAAHNIVHDTLGHYKDMETSEQAWANGDIHQVTCPNGKKSVLVRPPMRSDRMGLPAFRRRPLLGEDSDRILEKLGYSREEVEALKEKGVTRTTRL